MDKKSNRTDLLAAGRKKLQQYRQKKDNKGKDGKGRDGKAGSSATSRSTNKADKDSDPTAANTIPEPSKLPQGEPESTSSLPHSLENLLDSNTDAQNPSADTSIDSHNVDQLPTSASLDVGEPVPLMDPALVQASLGNLQTDSDALNEDIMLKSRLIEVEGVVSSGSTEIETGNDDALAPTRAGAVYGSEPSAAVPVKTESAQGGDQGQCRKLIILALSALIKAFSRIWVETLCFPCQPATRAVKPLQLLMI